MKMTRWAFAVALLFVSAAPAAGQAEAEARRILKADWSVGAKPSVIEAKFSNEAIAYFSMVLVLSRRTQVGPPTVAFVNVGSFGWKQTAESNKVHGALGSVADPKWADVDADGVFELLFLLDAGDNGWFTNLVVIKRGRDTFMDQHISILNSHEIVSSFSGGGQGRGVVLTDLDDDGRLELIVPVRIGYYQGARPTPSWTAVLRWEDGHYAEAGRQFREFYEDRVLPRVVRRIADMEREKVRPGNYEEALDAEWVTRDRLERLLGHDPRAGFERAAGWMRNGNPFIRLFAVEVLGEIPGENSSRYLALLAADKDRSVSSRASDFIRDRIHANAIDPTCLEFLSARIDEFVGRFKGTKVGGVFLQEHAEDDVRKTLAFLQNPKGHYGTVQDLPDLCAFMAAIGRYTATFLPGNDPSGLDDGSALTWRYFREADAENIALLTSLMMRCESPEIRFPFAEQYTKLFEIYYGVIVKDLERRTNWRDVIRAASMGDKETFFSGLAKLGNSPFEQELKAYAGSLKWRE